MILYRTKWALSCAVASVALLGLSANLSVAQAAQAAQSPAQTSIKPQMSDEAWEKAIDQAFVVKKQTDPVAKALQQRIEKALGVQVVVAKTPYKDLYEVHDLSDGATFYTNSKYEFVLSGYLFTTQLKNLTGSFVHDYYHFDPERLPKGLAIKHVNGNGARKVFTLEDPNCGYCRREDRVLYNLPNATIYTFPVAILAESSLTLARDIWCAPNPDQAWFNWMLLYQKPDPAPSTCQYPYKALRYLANKLGLQGTPLNLFENGQRVEGAISSPQDFEKIFATQHK